MKKLEKTLKEQIKGVFDKGDRIARHPSRSIDDLLDDAAEIGSLLLGLQQIPRSDIVPADRGSGGGTIADVVAGRGKSAGVIHIVAFEGHRGGLRCGFINGKLNKSIDEKIREKEAKEEKITDKDKSILSAIKVAKAIANRTKDINFAIEAAAKFLKNEEQFSNKKVAQALYEMALTGDIPAIREYLDRTEGKVTDKHLSLTLTATLTPALLEEAKQRLQLSQEHTQSLLDEFT